MVLLMILLANRKHFSCSKIFYSLSLSLSFPNLSIIIIIIIIDFNLLFR